MTTENLERIGKIQDSQEYQIEVLIEDFKLSEKRYFEISDKNIELDKSNMEKETQIVKLEKEIDNSAQIMMVERKEHAETLVRFNALMNELKWLKNSIDVWEYDHNLTVGESVSKIESIIKKYSSLEGFMKFLERKK